MPIIPWRCASGDAPPVTLVAAATVPIAPPDDSVDTNEVRIRGTGTISSLGTGPSGVLVTKRVLFTATSKSLTLVHSPPRLMLLGDFDHVIASGKSCFGRYQWDGASTWVEQSFTDPSQRPDILPPGTVLLFAQASVPPGWTRLRTLRIASGIDVIMASKD